MDDIAPPFVNQPLFPLQYKTISLVLNSRKLIFHKKLTTHLWMGATIMLKKDLMMEEYTKPLIIEDQRKMRNHKIVITTQVAILSFSRLLTSNFRSMDYSVRMTI